MGEDELEIIDDHEWEYYEEAIQEQLRQEKFERFYRMPEICRRCRWLDWYYTEQCSYNLQPKDGKCSKHCRDYGWVYRLPSQLRLIWWDLQYHWWDFWLKRKGVRE